MYEKAYVAADPVIFTLHDRTLKVYLKRREKEPFTGKYELPGGLVLPNETAEQTLSRKLAQTLGKHDLYFEQFHTFSAVDRDPRERAVSVGFIALVAHEHVSDLQHWHAVEKLPALAFDHAAIIRKAQTYLREHIDTLIVKQFLPAQFPLNRLQEAYEIIEGTKYDNRNFRKKMLTSGLVVETKTKEQGVSHRPATLYKFKR